MDRTHEPASPRWEWVAGPAARKTILGLIVLAAVSAVLLGLGLLPENVAYHYSEIVYVIVPTAAGLAVMAVAQRFEDRKRWAWTLIGLGSFFWGIGELIWILYEYLLSVEVPYPGWADVFYVLGYPVVFAGVLLLPAVRQHRMERLRLTLDALAGTVALSAVMWVGFLAERVYLDPEVGFLEQAVNILYPLGDLILLIAVMILLVRRTSHRFDKRLAAISVGLVADSVADVVYILQVEADAYVTGGRVDALWLISYGSFLLAARFLLDPDRTTEQTVRSTRSWQLVAPYAAVAILFTVTLWDTGGAATVLQLASAVVVILIIGRQAAAIRENRALVEKQRDDLIASISHELRTPLTSVQGFAQFLNESGDQLSATDRSEIATTIESQARHLGGIVTDLVDVARDRLGSTDLTLEDASIQDLVDGATAMLSSSMAETDLEVDVDEDLHIIGDRRRMTQVVVNLLTNALRYGEGHIEVRGFATNGTARIEVHDNGPGVPKRFEEAIWERFERGAHRLDATVPGSGIGLPIARSLVEAHGGSMLYRRSQRLGGSCFTISVPRVGVFEPVPAQTAPIPG